MASDGTDVNPDSVSEFGTKSLEEAKAFMQGTGRTISDISSAKAGVSGLAAGVSFAAAHGRGAKALGMFAKDAATGLQALGYGGMTIADNYRNADMSQAGQMNSVDAAFNPGKGTPSIASDQAAARSGGESPAPSRGPRDLPAPATGGVPADCDNVVTPQEQVARHNDIYGDNERWMPERD